MKRLVFLPVIAWLMFGLARSALAEPAWGVNCLSCHGVWYADAIQVYGEDLIADPDESGTGAPDRGPLPVFQVAAGQTRTLTAEILGLDVGDVYAVELKRLRFPGVENGGELTYTDDCGWAYWGEPGKYYTDPAVGYAWGSGPTSFAFDIEAGVDAPVDYYDVVFTVAGKLSNSVDLFYAEEHFYLHVTPLLGDMDTDGDVDLDDYDAFTVCFSGSGQRFGDGCEQGDFDGDEDIDCVDWDGFRDAWTDAGDPPAFESCPRDAIPTVSEWGLAAMILLLVVVGTVVFQRRGIRTG